MTAASSTRSAPAAVTRARSFGQPCTGLTIRNCDSPKLAMARAAAPMFSPICGSTRITTGPGCSIQRLVLSVPAPGMAESSVPGLYNALPHHAKARLPPPKPGCYRARNQHRHQGVCMPNLEIVWTKVDEAPGLATYSLLPIVEAFVATAGVKMKLKDISLTGRIIANFPDKLKPEQKIND